jgi:hypothetical protein
VKWHTVIGWEALSAVQIMHFLFVSSINAYKCHIINFLLTSLARS